MESSDTAHIAQANEHNRRIFEFLSSHPIGVLATVDQAHKPHATTIYYAVNEDFSVTFTTKRDTKKHAVLDTNPNVCLVVFEAFSQTTTQIEGVAEEMADQAAAIEAFGNTLKAAMQTSDAGVPPISKLFAGNYIAYCIRPSSIRMAVFRRPDKGEYDMFETIEFTPRTSATEQR